MLNDVTPDQSAEVYVEYSPKRTMFWIFLALALPGGAKFGSEVIIFLKSSPLSSFWCMTLDILLQVSGAMLFHS